MFPLGAIWLLTVHLILWAAAPALADAPEPLLTDEFHLWVQQLMKEWNQPGLAVAVVHKNTDQVWQAESKGYGVRNRKNDPVTKDTIFSIVSNTKLFTSLSLGLLVSDETVLLDWDSKIESILPEWQLQDPIASKQANLIDILSHRTGLPRHDFSYRLGQKPSDVVSSLRYLRPSAEFRDILQYNNQMYATAALIVERVSGMPYSSFVKSRFFDPLNLTSSTFNATRALESSNLAEGYAVFSDSNANATTGGWFDQSFKPMPYFLPPEAQELSAGFGGILSTARDMAVWLQTLLLEGRRPSDNQIVIPSTVIETVATGRTIWSHRAPYPELSAQEYGMGQYRYSYQGHELIEHIGTFPGFTSTIARFPADDLGIAILTNSDTGSFLREIIKWRIAEDILNLKRVDWDTRSRNEWTASGQDLTTPRSPNAPLPSLPFSVLEGIYSNPAYGILNLTFDGPTSLSTPYPSPYATRLIFNHFSKQVFNVTIILDVVPLPTYDNSSKSAFSYRPVPLDYLAEFAISSGNVVDGLGMTGGFWGASAGVPGPSGGTIKDRAEVWFERL